MSKHLGFNAFHELETYADTNGRFPYRLQDPSPSPFQFSKPRIAVYNFCRENFGEAGLSFRLWRDPPFLFTVTSTWMHVNMDLYWFDKEEDAVAFLLFAS